MKSLKVIVAGCIAFILSSTASATLITVNFDSFPTGMLFVAPVVENGILLTPINTAGNPSFNNNWVPSPSLPNHLIHTSPGLILFNVQDNGGLLFELISFELTQAMGAPQNVTVRGWLGGGIVGTEIFVPLTGVFSLASPTGALAGTLVDTLTFDLGLAGPGPMLLDNMIFNVVPEPSTFSLMALGLLGLAGNRRRA